MIDVKKITKLAENALQGTDRFVVEVNVSPANQISVLIDGDSGVTIEHCVAVSRYIENSLDRDTEDFELKVSTPGIDYPFTGLRQYRKNLGRAVQIELLDGTTKRGVLEAADEQAVDIKLEVKPKNKKSKKMETGPSLRIPMQEIRQTRCLVIF